MTTTTSKSDKAAGRVLLPSHVVPIRYDLSITPDLQAFTFVGTIHIVMNINKDSKDMTNEAASKSITLHAKELAFNSASYRLANTSEDVKAVEINVNLKATTVEFVFEKPFTSGGDSLTLTIQYTGCLNNQMAGFYRSSYTDIHGNVQIMASTQFESLDARRAFPCVDEPAAKAVFGVTLTIPSNRQCFSNMPVSQQVTLPNNQTKVSFLDTPKMASYLLAFCVGEFDSVQQLTKGGVLVQVYTPPGKSEQGRFALDAACQALDAYNDFFQIPYPLPKLDMVAIPEFAMGYVTKLCDTLLCRLVSYCNDH